MDVEGGWGRRDGCEGWLVGSSTADFDMQHELKCRPNRPGHYTEVWTQYALSQRW